MTYDPWSPEFVADPYPAYAELRRDRPVYFDEPTGQWVVTRHADVNALLRDRRLGRTYLHVASHEEFGRPEEPEFLAPFWRLIRAGMLDVEPPDHTRLRRLVSKAFTVRRIAALRPRVQEITDGLLDAVIPAGRADLVADLALPLPVTVISELLGVPYEDREGFQEWTDIMLAQHPDRPDKEAMDGAWRNMWAYLEDLLAAKRGRPGDDLLVALIAARDEDQSLDEDELVAMAFLLLVAGYITTVNLIGGGVAALLAHPQQLKLLRDDPGLLPGAVEELLRYDGPVNPGVIRFPTEDVEIGGVTIPRGATVLIATAVADRDPARFPDPDRLDVTRTENAHLAFGHGIHYCLGAPLARLEGEIAIGTVLRRLPNLALAVPHEDLEWQVASLRGPKRLPVVFGPG
jgi:cytochrome P450